MSSGRRVRRGGRGRLIPRADAHRSGRAGARHRLVGQHRVASEARRHRGAVRRRPSRTARTGGGSGRDRRVHRPLRTGVPRPRCRCRCRCRCQALPHPDDRRHAARRGDRCQDRRPHNATAREVLVELVELVASGAIEVPIAATYPLDRVADAFAKLKRRHARSKIVLLP
ncbi:zinc-binding dehydrogenase [Streptomyces shenzhenensis]|uniref:zinc-binding dehydrogenase n=1 Tax=Streptomyces shenzhenensis TaxID=943815 RepID=UPI0038D4BE91